MTKLYDKRPFLLSSVQHPFSTYACSFNVTINMLWQSFQKLRIFLYHARLLTIMFLEQVYVATGLIITTKVDGRHPELVGHFGVSTCTLRTDLFTVSKFSYLVYLDLTFYKQLGCASLRERLPFQRTFPVFPV